MNIPATESDPIVKSLLSTGLSIKKSFPLIVLGVFAVIWLIIRANLQSVTIDEADTYMYFVHTGLNLMPNPNNHVLNTLLINLFTKTFGLSHLTLRLPALIGGAVYIVAAFRLCVLVSNKNWLRIPLFICLVYNPFVMDYLVAARGYSLALGFLLLALFFFCKQLLSGQHESPLVLRTSAYASICIGLSFTANFSFAFVDASTAALFFVFALWDRRSGTNRAGGGSRRILGAAEGLKLASACFIPALIVVSLICGTTLLHWHKGELVYGSRSLREMWSGIFSASYYRLNPKASALLGPHLLTLLRKVLAYSFIAICALQIVSVTGNRQRDIASKRLVLLGAYVACIFTLTLSLHFICFTWFGLLLPKNRTSLFFVPLCTLALGIFCAIPNGTRLRGALWPIGLAVLSLNAMYFAGCLRLRYFQEWRFDADAKEGYLALQKTAHGRRDIDVPANWQYVSSLNFYRWYYRDNRFDRFNLPVNNKYPAGKPAYVLCDSQDQEFIERRQLKIVYHGKRTCLVVAAKE